MAYAYIAMAAIAAVKTISGAQQAQGAINQAQQERTQALQSANANEETVHQTNSQRLGEQRAAIAGSGFDGNSGSFLTLQTQSAGNARLDELRQRYQGQVSAWRASNEISSAHAAMIGGLFTGAGSAVAAMAGGSGAGGGAGAGAGSGAALGGSQAGQTLMSGQGPTYG